VAGRYDLRQTQVRGLDLRSKAGKRDTHYTTQGSPFTKKKRHPLAICPSQDSSCQSRWGEKGHKLTVINKLFRKWRNWTGNAERERRKWRLSFTRNQEKAAKWNGWTWLQVRGGWWKVAERKKRRRPRFLGSRARGLKGQQGESSRQQPPAKLSCQAIFRSWPRFLAGGQHRRKKEGKEIVLLDDGFNGGQVVIRNVKNARVSRERPGSPCLSVGEKGRKQSTKKEGSYSTRGR